MRELGNGNINFAVIHQILSHAGVQEPVPGTLLGLEWGPLMRPFQGQGALTVFLILPGFSLVLSQFPEGGFVSWNESDKVL